MRVGEEEGGRVEGMHRKGEVGQREGAEGQEAEDASRERTSTHEKEYTLARPHLSPDLNAQLNEEPGDVAGHARIPHGLRDAERGGNGEEDGPAGVKDKVGVEKKV